MPINKPQSPSLEAEAGSWAQYQLLVLAEINRADIRITQLESQLSNAKTELAVLKTKVIVVSSGIATILTAIFSFVLPLLKG